MDLDKPREERTLKYQNLVGRSLGKEVMVRQLIDLTIVECKNLDEIMREEDIRRKLVQQFQIQEGVSSQ